MNRMVLIKILVISFFFVKTEAVKSQERTILTDAVPIEVGCLNLNRMKHKNVINSKEEFYNEFYDKYSPHSNCSSFRYPDINFSNRTLVGYRYSVDGCRPPEISVKFYRQNNFIIHEISNKPYGNCRAIHQGILWFSIPKKSSDKIKFEFILLK